MGLPRGLTRYDSETHADYRARIDAVVAEAKEEYERKYPGAKWEDLDATMQALWRQWVSTGRPRR